MRNRAASTLCRLVAAALFAGSTCVAQCPFEWVPSGFCNTVDGQILCSVIWDDGTGPKLYVGGSFSTIGGAPASGLAAWDGTSWVGVGGGVSGGSVNALCVHDDGTGPALFVGGWFTGPGAAIAKWNGSVWSPLGVGVNSGVEGLASYDDGTGSALYLGGWFTTSGPQVLSRIAKWNGTTFSQVGTGLNSGMNECIVYNNALYIGGSFTTAGGVAAPRLARWNGAWSPVGSGANGDINAMLVFDPGTGPQLYIGGLFQVVNGVSCVRVARFDGTTWFPLGAGLGGLCYGLGAFDDGTGPAVYAAGAFTTAGGMPANRVAKWDGSAWSAVGNGVAGGPARTINSYPTANGNGMFVGGGFTDVGNAVPAPNLAIWALSPPVISTQPTNQLVNAGASATFSVVAGGGGLAYQWRHLGGAIAGATSPTLTIPVVTPNNWGNYDCVVTNGCGVATSAQANLTLNPAFLLTMTQPFGSLSLYINHNSPPQPGGSYLTTFSFDPQNGAVPGAGLWGGLHTTFNDIIGQFLFLVPPFVGTLDGAGSASFFLSPGQLPPSLLGTTVWVVSMTYNPMNLALINNSNVVSLLIS